MDNVRGILGLAVLLCLAWALSENRRRIPVRIVLSGLVLQVALALILIKIPATKAIFLFLNHAVDALQKATNAGTSFVFGYLGGASLPFSESQPGASFVFAFQALPLVLVISALATLLFHWGILQRIVRGFAWVLRRVMGIGGALGLGAAVHVFVGNIEAPLLVRPYLKTMERGELFALMTCGMAGVAGTVMVLYATILNAVIPDALGQVLTASVISTPAALAVAALMVPYGANSEAEGRLSLPDPPMSALDAIVKGTADGTILLVNIVVTLVVVIALVSLVNLILGIAPPIHGGAITLQRIFAIPFWPVMWLIGIPTGEVGAAAHLMATKTVINEFVAYVDLAHLPDGMLSPRSRRILIFALCGFANFGSAGIMVGGMSVMAPERKREILDLGMRSILSGTIATCMSGAIVGML